MPSGLHYSEAFIRQLADKESHPSIIHQPMLRRITSCTHEVHRPHYALWLYDFLR